MDEVSKSAMYEAGCRICEKYTDLTSKLRTQVVLVVVTYTIGVGVAMARHEELKAVLPYVLRAPGFVLIGLAVVFGVLNYHYSSAHSAIRSWLVCIEGSKGPWEAHRRHRAGNAWRKGITWLAWWAPFVAVAALGGISAWVSYRYTSQLQALGGE